MLKLSKKSDYGLIAVKHLATHGMERSQSASDIAEVYGISSTLLAKVLQKLAKNGLVIAQHGSAGGYRLAKLPSEITALDVISAIDGPLLITSCSTHRGECFQSSTCTVREPLKRVNESIMQVLATVTISQMSEEPEQPTLVQMQS